MTDADFSYDPVSAIDEASASGETAAIFADIRHSMAIPLVTSIWRGLAGMGDSLPTVWAQAKPLYLSGAPQAALARVIASADLPMPEPLLAAQLSCVGVSANELAAVRAIIAAYNRSNGMNLVALTALITPPGEDKLREVWPAPPPEWPPLPPLLAQSAIAADTWTLVRHVNAFGASGVDANVATLWRHLAHWPALLALIHAAFAPQQSSGAIACAIAQVIASAQQEGARMAHLRPTIVDNPVDMPERARQTITAYVTSPAQVARMVTLGHTLARWLD